MEQSVPNKERIKKDIVKQLNYNHRVDASRVIVAVEDGKVKLEGSVPTYMGRQIAEKDVFTVLGVLAVENNLEVKHSGRISAASDKKTKAESDDLNIRGV
jgi:osmotically-inducible protein OsmY